MAPSNTALQLLLDRLDARPRQVLYQEWLPRPSSWRPLPGVEARRLLKTLVHGLAAWGLGPGDRVGVLAGPSLRGALAEWAVMARGGVVVSLREGLPTSELRGMLDDADVRVAFVSAEQAPALTAALVDRDIPLTVIALEPTTIPGCRDVVAWHDFLEEGGELLEAEELEDWEGAARSIAPADEALICFSAGATGRPRLIRHDHGGLLAGARALRASGTARRDWRALLAVSPADLWVRTLALVVLEEGGVACFASPGDSLGRILEATNPELVVLSPLQLRDLHARTRSGHRRLEGARKLIVEAALGVAGEWAHKFRRERETPSLLRAEYAAADFAVLRHIRARFGRSAKRVVCGGGPLDAELLRFYKGVGIEVRHLLTVSEVTGALGWAAAPTEGDELSYSPVDGLQLSVSERGTLQVEGAALCPAARGGAAWDSGLDVRLEEGSLVRQGPELAAERVERGLCFHPMVERAAVAPHPDGGWQAQLLCVAKRRRGTAADASVAALREQVAPLVEATNARLPLEGRIRTWTLVPTLDRAAGHLTASGALRRRALEGRWEDAPVSS